MANPKARFHEASDGNDYVPVDDGRLPEEQPGTPWQPKGGERVAGSARSSDSDAYETEAVVFEGDEIVSDDRVGDAVGRMVVGLVNARFVPNESTRVGLQKSVEYLASDEFVKDIASRVVAE